MQCYLFCFYINFLNVDGSLFVKFVGLFNISLWCICLYELIMIKESEKMGRKMPDILRFPPLLVISYKFPQTPHLKLDV